MHEGLEDTTHRRSQVVGEVFGQEDLDQAAGFFEPAVLEVRGMSSAMCELQVKGALAGIEGVEVLSVDRTRSEAVAKIPSGSVEAQQLVDVVNAVGYATRLKGEPPPAIEESGLSAEELDRVAQWMAKRIIQTGDPAFDDDEVLAETGVRISEDHRGVLTNAVLDKLLDSSAFEINTKRLATLVVSPDGPPAHPRALISGRTQ